MRVCEIEECGKEHEARGWCRLHYERWRIHGDPEGGGRRYKTPEEAFEARTIPEPNTGCLLWVGATSEDGYGAIWVGNKNISPYKYSWERENGPVPPGLSLDHRCHTPPCVNVDHLRLATVAQNNQNLPRSRVTSSTGIRNVHGRREGVYFVVVKNNYFGTFYCVKEAAEVAEQKREELFKEYAGKG